MSLVKVTSTTVRSILRLALFIVILSAAASLCLLRQARAAVDEAMLGFGSSLMGYPDSRGEPVRNLQLNGAHLHFRTETIDAPSDVVLAHYEDLCDHRDALLAERLSKLLARHPRAPDRATALRSIATTTFIDAGRGYVACLDMGEDGVSLDALVSRFVRFSRTGDLHEIGQARYAYAQPIKGSGGGRTFLLTMWTTADFNLYDMLPADGRDATGFDPEKVPRPPNSRRILSSRETGHSSAVSVYLAKASSASMLERFYREELPARDWKILERHAGERLQIDKTRLVSAHRGNDMVTVLAHPSAIDRTVVTILTVEAP